MERREALLVELSSQLHASLVHANLDSNVLRVQHGGRQANYSPVPWVRIFDPEHAPTAQSGFYVVLLFAADGSSVYLSLYQGNSEFRSNKMRPIMKDEVLLNRASGARLALSDWASEVAAEGLTSIDLKGGGYPVGVESRRRIRNYELANIYAYRYPLDDLPSDSEFTADVEELLVLLWALESVDLSAQTKFVAELPVKGTSPSQSRPSSKQGRQLNERVKRLIELAAEDQSQAHFEAAGWTVERVGAQKLGYDLRCTKDDEELHVEVKGTASKGLEVVLTPNEVAHCRQYPHMALAVVREIKVGQDETIESPGKLRVIDPWSIDESHLTPSEYSYRIPSTPEVPTA
jgi:hypothetical protein